MLGGDPGDELGVPRALLRQPALVQEPYAGSLRVQGIKGLGFRVFRA